MATWQMHRLPGPAYGGARGRGSHAPTGARPPRSEGCAPYYLPARLSLYGRSCSSPLAAGGAEQPLYLLLESPHREAEYGRFVVRWDILRPALLALLQLLAGFQP